MYCRGQEEDRSKLERLKKSLGHAKLEAENISSDSMMKEICEHLDEVKNDVDRLLAKNQEMQKSLTQVDR